MYVCMEDNGLGTKTGLTTLAVSALKGPRDADADVDANADANSDAMQIEVTYAGQSRKGQPFYDPALIHTYICTYVLLQRPLDNPVEGN